MMSQEEIKMIAEVITKPLVEQIRVEFASVIEDNINPQFQELRDRMDKVDGRLDKVDGRLDKVDGRLDKIESNVDYIKERMVTQSIFSQRMDALDDRLTDQMLQTNQKINTHVNLTRNKGVLTKTEADGLLAMPPFAKSST